MAKYSKKLLINNNAMLVPKSLLHQWVSKGPINIAEVHEVLGHYVHFIDELGSELAFGGSHTF